MTVRNLQRTHEDQKYNTIPRGNKTKVQMKICRIKKAVDKRRDRERNCGKMTHREIVADLQIEKAFMP